MFLRTGSCAFAAAISMVFAAPLTAERHDTPAERLEADVRFLADDALEGRLMGTPGFDLAAGYVAGQYAAIGLEPSANGTFFQNVPLMQYGVAQGVTPTISIEGLDGFANFVGGQDYIVFGSPRFDEREIEGELVFVNYGFRAEGFERDDLANVDLTGKIAVVFRGAPDDVEGEEGSHLAATQNQRLSEAGAIATITLYTPSREERFPWERLQSFISNFRPTGWVDDDGLLYSSAPGLRASATLGPAAAEALFEGQPASWEEIVAAEQGEGPGVPSFALGLTARLTYELEIEETSSNNVIAVLPGSDPEVAHEVILVTAHLDHLGVRPASEEGEDTLYNGAMDNASGTAAMLEVARSLVDNPPRRTVMFAAVTAEEQGLLGSDYLARKPVLAEGQIVVANVNLDMPIVTYPFSDVVAFGAEHSTLEGVVRKAAESRGLSLAPDPMPQENFFVRSDQYSFVKQGVPAVYLDLGWGNGGEEAQTKFLEEHYHKPSDESELIDYNQLARLADVNAEIIRQIGEMEEAPKWKKGNFFGRTYGGPMED